MVSVWEQSKENRTQRWKHIFRPPLCMGIEVTKLNKTWILRTCGLVVSLFKWEEETPAASLVMPLSLREVTAPASLQYWSFWFVPCPKHCLGTLTAAGVFPLCTSQYSDASFN